ncbi:unnamed protein product [Zymoseptoria tritici ST99CH_1A5]|uniref:Zn(2)-C6 fungal-type domain-containing protein n=1 Tax=Zymoseptoria tritici ST99CH_1A5 TaxID=1276529 RepID=A0A1Y6LET9_ZYMTR|nr:unnamed protein product [Zymoseptoria tritici ST99CH_1A5]
MASLAPEVDTTSLKRIRKGTKSCIECRQRKIKCIWPDGHRLCSGCNTRGKQCVPQIYQKRSTATDRVTSRDRINRLEQQIANIAAAVQDKGSLPSTSPVDRDHAVDDTMPDEEGHDPSLDGPATDPPSHLKFLFENPLIGPSQRLARHKEPAQPPCSPQYLESARARLQRLLPTRQDVEAIVPHAAKWMELYTGLFPVLLRVGSPQQMVDMHQDMISPLADPTRIAMFLMAFTMTVRQIPPGRQITSIKDTRAFSMDVIGTIESTIISHQGFSSTVEGLSTTIMHCRLQMGLGKMRPVWLQLRRVVALAELMGLPRTCYGQSVDTENDPQAQERIALWDTICATDRLSSMLYNLPAATVTHQLRPKKFVDEDGKVITQALMFEIATLAMRIQNLDESSIRHDPPSEVYEKVLRVDKDLRALKASTPSSWWASDHTQTLGPRHLIQFWFTNITVRTHMRTAMSKDEHDHYAYSRMTCFDAAKTITRMYTFVRPRLPAGFFACRIIDMQIFSCAVYLLMSSYDAAISRAPPRPDLKPFRDGERLALVQKILATMDSVSDQVGAEFAKEAAAAFRGLQAMLEGSEHAHPEGVTLHIPLLGKIHVGGRPQAEQLAQPTAQTSSAHNDQQQPLSSLPALSSTIHHGEIRIPAMANGECVPQQISTFTNLPYTSDFGNMPWMLEWDMNSSSLQDPFIADGYDGLDQWMDLGYGAA